MLINKLINNTLPMIVGIGTNLISVPLFLKYMGENDYGIYLLFTAIVGALATFQLGIPKIIVKTTSEKNYSTNKIYNSGAIISIGLAIVGSVSVGIIEYSTNYLRGNFAEFPLKFLLVYVPIYYVLNLVGNFLIGLEEYKINSLMQISVSTSGIAVALMMSYYKIRLDWIIITVWTIKGLILFIFTIFLFNKLKISFSLKYIDFDIFRRNSNSIFWITFGMLSSTLVVQVDQLLIGSLGVASLMAIYKVVTTPYDVLQNISRGILGVTLPRTTKAFSRGNKVGHTYLIKLHKRITFYIYCLSILAALMTKPFINIWVPQYAQYGTFAALLCLFFGLTSSTALFYNYFIIKNNLSKISLVQLSLAISNVIIGYVGLDYFSWKSVIYANFITLTLAFITYAAFYIYGELGGRYRRTFMRYIISYLLIAIIVYLISYFQPNYSMFEFILATPVTAILVYVFMDLVYNNLNDLKFLYRKLVTSYG